MLPALKFARRSDPTRLPDDSKTMTSDRNLNNFKSALRGYGESTIKSALEHPPEESDILEENIVTSRDKVIGKYEDIAKKLKAEEEKSKKIVVRNASLTKDKASLEKKLREEKATAGKAKKDHAGALLFHSTMLKTVKDELSAAKANNSKKRKREELSEIWERAEKTKLGK